MITSINERQEQSDDRLRLKTQDQTLMRLAISGAGLTPWEAKVLPQVVEEVYFSTPGSRPWQDGQVRYQCVAASAGPGRPLAECPQVPVVLTVFRLDEDRATLREHGAIGLRQAKVCRITEEAREQGGLLTQEDLGVLLACDERTIRRDVAVLKKRGIHVATRGFVQDIGPTLSHKALAIRHWLGGKEPVAVARAIAHSLVAVERYLEAFKRVAFLSEKGLDEVAVARSANLSPALVRTYRAIVAEVCATPGYVARRQEMDISHGTTSPAEDAGKKGALPTNRLMTDCPSAPRV